MTLDDFDKGMARLERMFNRGILLGDDMRLEYLHALRFLEPAAFEAAVTMVIETFKPFPSEPFPSLATIQDAVTMAQSEDQVSWPGRRGAPDASILDFCQRCRNRGLYLTDGGQARSCLCEKGRIARASWGVPYGVRRREAKIQDELDKLPPSKGPVRGLQEKSPLGFWELTKEEHERWCEAKRCQIKALELRDAERKRERAGQGPRMIGQEPLRQAVARIGTAAEAGGAEPGEEEDEIPL